MNYSNELIQYLKERPFRNIDELIGKEKFVEKVIGPLAKEAGYGYAKYSLLFTDGNFWGEVVEVHDKDGTHDFNVCVDANSKMAIAEECAKALGSGEKRQYLSKFRGARVEFISPTEAKNIMFRKEDTTIRGLLRMNIDIDVYDDDSDGIGIAFCGPVGLTDEGRKEWRDILYYKVSFVDETIAGDIAVVKIPDDVDYDEKLDRCSEFFGALAGYCSQEDWEKWFYWLDEDAE